MIGVALAPLDLKKKTLAVGPGPDPGRLQPILDGPHGPLEQFRGHRDPGDVLVLIEDRRQVGAEQAVVVDVRDQALADGSDLGVDLGERPLMQKLLDEALAPGRDVRHRVHLLVALAAGPRRRRSLRGVRVVEGLAVVGLQRAEALPVVGAGGGVLAHDELPLLKALLALLLLSVGLDVVGLDGRIGQLQGHIRLQLLVDPLLQRQKGHVQDLHRLDHPRRQLHLLGRPHVLAGVEAHGWRRGSGARGSRFGVRSESAPRGHPFVWYRFNPRGHVAPRDSVSNRGERGSKFAEKAAPPLQRDPGAHTDPEPRTPFPIHPPPGGPGWRRPGLPCWRTRAASPWAAPGRGG